METDTGISFRSIEIVCENNRIYTLEEWIRKLSKDYLGEKLGAQMDKEIRDIEKDVKKTGKKLKSLEKADKKRDPACDLGAKMMKKKKKK